MKKKKRIIIIISSLLMVLLIAGISTYLIIKERNGNIKYLKIKLNGENEVTINYKEEYKDKGAKASYKSKDITKDIKTTNDLNLEKIGTYTYTYTIKYKKHVKSIKRIVNIVDKEAPVLELNGKEEITLYKGNEYKEEGAKALDNYDGDITDKIEISGEVEKDKIGEYIITYKVIDSSKNEVSIERKIKVIEKPKGEQKVAVLNYHFFYEDWSEGCHETICEKMDRFREQLKWLNDNGYKTLTMNEFVDWMYGNISIPEKSVLITIDDGAYGTGAHNGNHLIPALEMYNAHATLFLITGWWDISNYQSPYLEVQSHTHDLHIEENCGYRSKVNCVGYDRLLADLKQSIEVTKSNTSFCFPFYEATNESIQAVKDAGFKVAFVGGNRKASRSDNKYRIPRFPIQDSTSLSKFIEMVK